LSENLKGEFFDSHCRSHKLTAADES